MEYTFDIQTFIRKFGQAHDKAAVHELIKGTPGLMSQCFFMNLTKQLLAYELELDNWRPLKDVYVRGSLDNLTIAFIQSWKAGTVKLEIYYRRDKADTINLDKLKNSTFYKESLRLETTSELARLGQAPESSTSKEDWKLQIKPIFSMKTNNKYIFINTGLNTTYGHTTNEDDSEPDNYPQVGDFPVTLYGLEETLDERWVINAVCQDVVMEPIKHDNFIIGFEKVRRYDILLCRFWRNEKVAVNSFPPELIADIAKRFLTRDPDVEFIGIDVEGAKRPYTTEITDIDKTEMIATFKPPAPTKKNFIESIISSILGKK